MIIIVEKSVYDIILEDYGEQYVFSEGQEYGVYISELVDAGYAQEIDGAYYTISLNPSQKGIFIGNL